MGDSLSAKDNRCKAFLGCLGAGKCIYQLEAENDLKDEIMLQKMRQGVVR